MLTASCFRAVSVLLGVPCIVIDVHPVSGDNGSMNLWDYATGTSFQTMEDLPQPGSLEAEAGIFCSTFDQTGTRLITGGADKTIKVIP